MSDQQGVTNVTDLPAADVLTFPAQTSIPGTEPRDETVVGMAAAMREAAAKQSQPERAAERLVATHKHVAATMKALQAVQAQAKDDLRALLEEMGWTEAETASGRAYFTEASERVTYDARALDALLDLPQFEALRKHRKVTQVAPALTVR